MLHRIVGPTIDDLMRSAVELTLKDGVSIHPKKGPCRDITAATLELTNPRARVSRTETRGTIFSCLGELIWYLDGSDDESHITHYLKKYAECAIEERLPGAYGPRMFGTDAFAQVHRIIEMLKNGPDTRQAVLQLFAAADLIPGHNDVPCTCTLQFVIREGRLTLMVYMRSNDLHYGTPHDIFSFTMIQEGAVALFDRGARPTGVGTELVRSSRRVRRTLPRSEEGRLARRRRVRSGRGEGSG